MSTVCLELLHYPQDLAFLLNLKFYDKQQIFGFKMGCFGSYMIPFIEINSTSRRGFFQNIKIRVHNILFKLKK